MTELPTDIEATYPDASPGDTAHQAHHDTIHAFVNGHPAAPDPHGDRAYADGLVEALRGVLPLNVRDYGATGDGVTDDAAAITAAVAALPASGGALYFPAGTYLLGSAITLNKPALFYGDGYATNLRTSSASANIFTVTGAEQVEVRGLRFTSSVARTAGWYVDVAASANRFRLADFFMDGFHGGVRTAAAATATIEGGQMLNGVATTGTAVRIDAGVDVTVRDILVDAASQIYSGVYITATGDVTLTDCQLIHAGDALRLEAQTGKAITSVWATGCFFDNSARGVVMQTGGGNIARCRLDSCWAASSTAHGIVIDSTGGGTIDGVDINACHVFDNAGNGILVTGSATENVRIDGCTVAGQVGQSGVAVLAGVSQFAIQNCRIGDSHGFPGNAYGIYIEGGAGNNYQVTDNDLRGNTTTPLSNAATGTARVVANNLGHNPGGTADVTVGASPWTYTAGAGYETLYVRGGTVSSVTVEGVTAFASTNVSVRLAPGKSAVVTYSAAPSAVVTKD